MNKPKADEGRRIYVLDTAHNHGNNSAVFQLTARQCSIAFSNNSHPILTTVFKNILSTFEAEIL